MQRVQRKFGAFLPRTADNAEVGTLIAEFREADKALENLIQASKHWRDAWSDILRFQSNIAHDFDELYHPILATTDLTDVAGPRHVPVETPRLQLGRAEVLNSEYEQLRTDMLDEVKAMDTKIIQPAEDARHGIMPMKKTIKRREDRKLDYERYQSRVDAIDKKYKRSDRDTNALNKHQGDLERAVVEYRNADDLLKECLPPLVNALLSIFPYLLEAQIQIQNTLLAQCYTSLHGYCQDHGFPFPAAEIEDIVAQWDADWAPTRKELEGQFKMLAVGKVIREPVGVEKGKSYTGLGIRNGINARRGSGQQPVSQERPRIQSRSPARGLPPPSPQPSIPEDSRPNVPMSSKPRMNSYSSQNSLAPPTPGDGLIRVASGSSLGRAYSNPASSNGDEDYFATSRPTGSINPYSSTPIMSPAAAAAAAVAKKKPPPPPPKRLPSHTGTFVTALYDFDGEGAADLSFREGDRIRVVKKTESEQDWWEGELRGKKGAFPANYCKIES